MDTKRYSILNETKESSLSEGVAVIDSSREPLTVLRVLIEGLAGKREDAGIWLTHVTGIPMVPRISPFDLVYLDRQERVVEGVELLPSAEIPPFREPAASALVLPFQTISSSQTRPGDQLKIRESSNVEEEILAISASVMPAVAIERAGNSAELFMSNDVASSVGGGGSSQPRIASQRFAPLMNLGSDVRDVDSSTARPPRRSQAIPRLPRHSHKKRSRHAAFAASAIPAFAPSNHRVDTPLQIAEATLAQIPASEPLEQSPMPATEKGIEAPALLQIAEAHVLDLPTAEPIELPMIELPKIELPQIELPDAEPPRLSIEVPVMPQIVEAPTARVPKAEPRKVLQMPALQKYFAAPPPLASTALPASPPPNALGSPQLEPCDPVPQFQTRSSVQKEKKPAAQQANEQIMGRFLRWLYPAIFPEERRGALRRPSPGLVAYHSASGASRMHVVADISATGIYLLTNERWSLNDRLAVTLQRKGPPEQLANHRIQLTAGTARWGTDGVGLTFDLPLGMEPRLWEGPARHDRHETVPEFILREFRTAKALAFLTRICPPVAEQASHLLHQDLSNVRAASAVEIALEAEAHLGQDGNAAGMLAHPEVVIRILDYGSWADSEWIQQLWGGLLASSCTAEGQDESNLLFVEMLSQFAPVHARILNLACAKATEAMSVGDSSSPSDFYCTEDEMVKITNSTNLAKIHKAIAELSDIGLLENTFELSLLSHLGTAKTAPTRLGLEMYARCHGFLVVA